MVHTVPPQLNWVYVDRTTLEVRHGSKSQSLPNIVGSWDWTLPDREGVVLEKLEGWMAVEEGEKGSGQWGLYFDKDDDGLEGVEALKGKRRVVISLDRKMMDGSDPAAPAEKANGEAK